MTFDFSLQYLKQKAHWKIVLNIKRHTNIQGANLEPNCKALKISYLYNIVIPFIIIQNNGKPPEINFKGEYPYF